MSVDLSKFLPMYFEESSQSLLVLERLLSLTLEGKDLDQAVRAAHSIKGSSGAFGFEEVVELSEALEYVLRQLEQRRATMLPERLALCTEAVALLRAVLQRRQQGFCGDAALTAAMSGRLAACLLENRSE